MWINFDENFLEGWDVWVATAEEVLMVKKT